MIDPFTAWSRLLSAGFDMQATWLGGLETLQASQSVIAARTGKMHDAMMAPMDTDLVEFARMMPEKVDAFSRSARSVMRGTLAMHRAWSVQMQRVWLSMMAGRLPTVAEATRLAKQTVEYSLEAFTAGVGLCKGALAPVHRTAAGNARRLQRARS